MLFGYLGSEKHNTLHIYTFIPILHPGAPEHLQHEHDGAVLPHVGPGQHHRGRGALADNT